MERGNSNRANEARIRPETPGMTSNPRTDRIVRFAPERSGVLNRQKRILHGPSIIEVPENMYARGTTLDLD